MRFADFRAGQVLVAGPMHVDEASILAFAREHDPQWFHTDAAAAARGPFHGLIASGWQTCAIAMRLVVDHFLRGSESFGSPGVAYVRWPHPVRPEDALSLRADVLEVRRSRSQPTLGILRWRWRLTNGDDIEVLDLEVTSLFDLAEAERRS
jgi:acyl dehydratase